MKVTLKDVRLAFPDLFEARAFNGEGEAKFGASFLFPPDHPAVAEVEKAIEAAAEEKWKDKAKTTLKSVKAKGDVCLHDGNLKEELAGYAGNFYISARSSVRPTVVDRDRSPLAASDGRPYGGCYVNAILELWAQDHPKYGKRINATLSGVQFVRDGDAFVGGTPARAEDFDDLGVEEEGEEELA